MNKKYLGIIEGNEGWREYDLLDSGQGEKLERFGDTVIKRADPRSIWNKSLTNDDWGLASEAPESWQINYGLGKKEMAFELRKTEFGHVGVFAEQAANWKWIYQKLSITNYQLPIKVLNLFAYTGGATMAAALAGAEVTHVDSSRPAMMWASSNCKLNKLPVEQVRWIQDDALKFIQREIRRNVRYDGIIMDPPRFGRGASGEVWKLEESLPKLVWAAKQILTPKPIFWLINAYTADLSSLALSNLLSDATADLGGTVEFGEVAIRQKDGERMMPSGIMARWSGV